MAKDFLRRTIRSAMIVINVIVTVPFLLACLSPYMNPVTWWLNGFTGLIVPYLILLLLFFLVFWLLTKPSLALFPLLTLCIGWKQLSVVFAWHPGSGISKMKRENYLRLVDWNVRGFNGIGTRESKPVREEVATEILKLEPDVICLQEFNHAALGGPATDNLSLFSKQYRYHYFSRDYQHGNKGYQSGCVIFSKYPVIDSGKVKFPVAESLVYVDILKGTDTIRIFTTHLQSFKFKQADYDDLEKIREQDEETLAASKNIFRKMKLAFSRRGVQANMVREAMDKSPYPSILCGDFNDVPNSFTYFHIKGGWQDAFLRKGFAIGRTFKALAPSLRIDYILTDKNFDIKQFDMFDTGLSDHIMLASDIMLKK